MLEYITTIHNIEARLVEGEGFAFCDLILDAEPLLLGVAARSREGRFGRVHTCNRETESGELLSEQAASATDIERAQSGRLETELLQQDPPHVAEAGGSKGRQHEEPFALIPPSIGEAVVERVVGRHVHRILRAGLGRCVMLGDVERSADLCPRADPT